MSSNASVARRATAVGTVVSAVLALAFLVMVKPASAAHSSGDLAWDDATSAGPLSDGLFPDGVPGLSNGPLSEGVFPNGVPGLNASGWSDETADDHASDEAWSEPSTGDDWGPDQWGSTDATEVPY